MRKNVALVLSGGGAREIAHIGVIEELEKQEFEIKPISGIISSTKLGLKLLFKTQNFSLLRN